MKHLSRLAVLSLFCVPVFASTYPDEINYPYFERIYLQENQTLESLTRQMNALSSEVRSLSDQLNRLNLTYQNNSTELNNINISLRNLSQESIQLNYQFDRLRREERELAARASRSQSDYERMRREVDIEARRLSPLRDQIGRAERELQSLRNTQNNEVRQLNSAQYELRTAQNELNQVKSEVMRLSSNPNRTPHEEAKLSGLRQRQFSLDSDVARKSSAVSNHQMRAQQLSMQVSGKENEVRMAQAQLDRESQRLRVLEQQLAQIQREYNQLNDSLRITRSNLSNTERRISSIRIEVSNLETRRRNVEQNQFNLDQEIRNAQSRLRQATNDLRVAENGVRSQTSVAEAAYDQYLNRFNLYNRYHQEAQGLGQGQVVTAAKRGSEQGVKDAKTRGEALGKTIGDMLSKAQGNLWGAMRAEVEGYQIGYQKGYNSPKTEAQEEAKKDAFKSAQNFVESVIRPQYFEEEVRLEIKKPFVVQKGLLTRSQESLMYREIAKNKFELSAEEREASLDLLTDYDPLIVQFQKDEQQAKKKREEAANAATSFTQQTKYPLDQVNCSSVYKGVSDFKKACEDSFKAHYANVFEENAYETYIDSFSDFFDNSFETRYSEVIGSHYKTAYDMAYAVTHAFGIEQGKAVMFKEAYRAQFDLSYPEFVESEKRRVKSEVPAELREFLSKNALLTMTGIKFDEELIAGSEITLGVSLRNLGKGKSGVATFKILNTELAQTVSSNVRTAEIPGSSVVNVNGPVVRISSHALTAQTVKVQVEATLPGDKYRSMRTEVITFEKKVAANPTQTISLNVDQTPAVRSVLRRFLIHTLSADLSPRFEHLNDELEVRLNVVKGSEHVDLKNSTEGVGPMNLGSKKNVKFSYVFKDSAKSEVIELALELVRKGKVIQTEKIELRPH